MPGEPAQWTGLRPGDPDLVETGPREISAARRRLVACLVVVLAIVGASAWFLDARWRAREYTALLDCVATAESNWTHADAQVAAMASYVRPTVGSGPSPTIVRDLYRLVAQVAAADEPSVRRALGRCAGVAVPSFHPAMRAARTAYLACLRAEVHRLDETARDGQRAFASSDGLTRLRARALTTLTAAASDAPGRLRAQQLMDRGSTVVR